MKFEMKRGLALLLCLAMVVGVFVGVPGMTTVADAAASSTTKIGDPTNYDFESPLSLSNWTVSNSAKVTVAGGAGIDGSNALFINDDMSTGGTAATFYATSDRIAVSVGTTYTLSAYIKGTAKTRLDLVWLDADGTVLSTSSATETQATDSWQQVSVTAVAPENAAYAQVKPFTGMGVTGQVYYDNIAFAIPERSSFVPAKPSGLATSWRNATNYTNAGYTVSYDTATDTQTITSPATAGSGTVETWYPINSTAQNNVSDKLPESTTYVLSFRISGSTTSGTQQGYIQVKDMGTSTVLGTVTFNGDGLYSLLFTANADNLHRLYAYTDKAYVGSYSISDLSVKVNNNLVDSVNGITRRSNVAGWLAQNYATRGYTVKYTAGLDSIAITNPGTNTQEGTGWVSFNLTAGITYVAKYTISNSTTSGTDQGFLAIKDSTAATTYVKSTHNGDGEYTFEFTPDTSALYKFFYHTLTTYNGSYSLSNISLTEKAEKTVNNSSFEDVSLPGWTVSSGTWTISEGRNSTQGLALIDNSTTAYASVTSDYIPVNANYARQRPVGYMGAKGTGLTGVNYIYHYYDENYVELKPTSETWSGASKGLAWRAATGSRTDISESWGTKALSTTNSYMYIPYGTRYLTIEICTGTAVGDTGTLYIDNVYVNLYCEHINGTHEDATTTAESTLVHHEAVAASYLTAGNVEYYDCSVCGVKYSDEAATTVISTDVNIAQYQVRENIRKGNSLSMIFGLDAAALTALSIDPETVTADIESVDGKAATVTGLEYDSVNAIYYAEFSGIAAKEMSRTVTANFYVNGDAEPFATSSTSIRSYAFGCINDTTGTHTQAWKNCCVDMLNYGAAAQEYFDYGTDAGIILANKDLTATSGTTFSSEKARSFTTGEDLFVGSNIRFQCNLTMLFAVKADSGATRGVITFTNHNGDSKEASDEVSVSQTIGTTEAVYFEFGEMVVADLNCDINIKIYDAEGNVIVDATDSMAAYVNRIVANSQDANMVALANAFALFGTSAYTFHNSEV